MEQWEKNPIPEHLKDNLNTNLMTTVEGIEKQISNLSTGTGLIMVAVMDETRPGQIRTESILVNKE